MRSNRGARVTLLLVSAGLAAVFWTAAADASASESTTALAPAAAVRRSSPVGRHGRITDDPLQQLSRAAGLAHTSCSGRISCLGLTLTWAGARLAAFPRWKLGAASVHRASLVLGFTALHLVALLGFKQNAFTLVESLVPFTRQPRIIEPMLGILSVYLLLIVAASSYGRRHLPQRWWRPIHGLSFACFVLAFGHAILAGPHTQTWWARTLYASSTGVVIGLAIWRLRRGSQPRPIHAPVRQLARAPD